MNKTRKANKKVRKELGLDKLVTFKKEKVLQRDDSSSDEEKSLTKDHKY